MLRKILVGLLAVVLFAVVTYGQFADCSTGLLQMPTADMQPDGTFMITNNFLNRHSLASSGWNYNTFQYGICISFWERVEVGYVCTIYNGAWDPRTEAEIGRIKKIMRNQDRHFTGRVKLLREGEFGLNWIPALVVGARDPLSGGAGTKGIRDYSDISTVEGTGNGFFNCYFVAISKHFLTPGGLIGTHLGYQFNRRVDYPINGPCVGISWQPVWIQQKGILDSLKVIAEYDSRTFNMGLIASLWQNRFEAMFELQNLRWVNFGLRYKLRLKKIVAS